MSPHASEPPAAQPPEVRHLPLVEFNRWYGGWEPLDPSTIAAFMDGFDRPWWIIGGWSIEAFTGVPRHHEDMDIFIRSSDAEDFRRFLGDRWTPWNVDEGWFRPFDDRFTDVRPDSQVWVRRDARSPWILDIPFTPDTDGSWTKKRHIAHTESLEDVTWVASDGLCYASATSERADRCLAPDEGSTRHSLTSADGTRATGSCSCLVSTYGSGSTLEATATSRSAKAAMA